LRKVFALTFALVLLISVFCMGFGGVAVADPYIPPEEAPSGYRIYSNGTFDVPSLRQDGGVYTFTSDINGTIVIDPGNVTLDGAGYILTGDGDSIGIWLQDKSNSATTIPAAETTMTIP